MFIVLRDGTGFLQCVLNDLLVNLMIILIIYIYSNLSFIYDLINKQCQTYDAILLSTEATICLYGKIQAVPEGKKAPKNIEMLVDYYEVVGHSPPGGADNVMNEVTHLIIIKKYKK